ncbi:MAG: sulfatase [Phycisphaerales bacterium]|nr:MAG: sulfatase [Phycisphaerales bacterium]
MNAPKPAEPDSSGKADRQGSWKHIILTGMTLGLCLAFCDVCLSLASGFVELSSAGNLATALSVTTVVSIAGYLALWLMVGLPMRKFATQGITGIQARIGFILGLALALAALPDLAQMLMLSPAKVKPALLIVLTGLVPVGMSSLARRLSSAAQEPCARSPLGVTTLMILAEVCLLGWLIASESGSAALWIVLAVCIGATVWVCTRPVVVRQQNKILVALLIVVVSSPLLHAHSSPLSPQSASASVSTNDGPVSGRGKHPVRHVILLTVDALRYNALSCNDPQAQPTPNFDALAADGVVFDSARASAPWTLTSFASIMTGVSPTVHEALRPESKVPEEFFTLAERMHDAGYSTAAIGSNPVLRARTRLSQGFDEYEIYPKPDISMLGGKVLSAIDSPVHRTEASTEDLTRLTISWLERNAHKDFFLWLHYFDPHAPYDLPEHLLPDPPDGALLDPKGKYGEAVRSGWMVPTSAERSWFKSHYAAEVGYVDQNLGVLVSKLKEFGIYDDALIVLTSDHGEEFWEHESFEHGHTIYDELLRVPLMVKLPAVQRHARVTDKVTLESIAPTILTLCAVDYESTQLPAPTLPALSTIADSRIADLPIVSTGLACFENRTSVVFDNFKYIRWDVSKREELFDLESDPGERYSVSSAYPEAITRGRQLFQAHMTHSDLLKKELGLSDAETATIDPKGMLNLKSLGYIR